MDNEYCKHCGDELTDAETGYCVDCANYMNCKHEFVEKETMGVAAQVCAHCGHIELN